MKKWTETSDKGNYTAGPSLSCFPPEQKQKTKNKQKTKRQKKKKRQTTKDVNIITPLWQTQSDFPKAVKQLVEEPARESVVYS